MIRVRRQWSVVSGWVRGPLVSCRWAMGWRAVRDYIDRANDHFCARAETGQFVVSTCGERDKRRRNDDILRVVGFTPVRANMMYI